MTIWSISVLVFFASLIGLCLLMLVTVGSHQHTRTPVPEYGIDLRSILYRSHRYWKRYGVRYWQHIIASSGGIVKKILYKILSRMQKGLMKLIRYIEHHESKSRQALRERKTSQVSEE